MKGTLLFKRLSLMAIFAIASQAYAIDKKVAMKFYFDGIYDSYSQIEDSIKKGLKKERLNQFRNKYIVFKDADNAPFVKLLMYKTIAFKNNLTDVTIGKDPSTKKDYIIFGGYDRKADAEYIRQRLMENSINAQVAFNDKTFVRDPIIVNQYIEQARKLIKNLPVKVIEIEKRYYIPELKRKKSFQCIKIKTPPSKQAEREAMQEYEMLKRHFDKTKISSGGHILYIYREDLGGMNAYTKGDYVTKHLKLKDFSYKRGKYIKATIVTPMGKKLSLVKYICTASSLSSSSQKPTAGSSSSFKVASSSSASANSSLPNLSYSEQNPIKSAVSNILGQKNYLEAHKLLEGKTSSYSSSSSIRSSSSSSSSSVSTSFPVNQTSSFESSSSVKLAFPEIPTNFSSVSSSSNSSIGNSSASSDFSSSQKTSSLKAASSKSSNSSKESVKKGYYSCNFEKIRTFAYSLEPSYGANRERIEKLPISKRNNKVRLIGVVTAKEGQAKIKYAKLKAPSTKAFYIRLRSFKKHCRPKEN